MLPPACSSAAAWTHGPCLRALLPLPACPPPLRTSEKCCCWQRIAFVRSSTYCSFSISQRCLGKAASLRRPGAWLLLLVVIVRQGAVTVARVQPHGIRCDCKRGGSPCHHWHCACVTVMVKGRAASQAVAGSATAAVRLQGQPAAAVAGSHCDTGSRVPVKVKPTGSASGAAGAARSHMLERGTECLKDHVPVMKEPAIHSFSTSTCDRSPPFTAIVAPAH